MAFNSEILNEVASKLHEEWKGSVVGKTKPAYY